MQAAGNFVRLAVKFSARVQHGHHDFRRRALFRLVHVHGDAAAVVHHGDRLVGVHRHADFVGETGQRFVHGVVYHFPNEMMQAHFSGRADIHGRTQTHGLEATEDLDRLRVVLVACALWCDAAVFFITHRFSYATTESKNFRQTHREQAGVVVRELKNHFSVKQERRVCGISRASPYPVIPARWAIQNS